MRRQMNLTFDYFFIVCLTMSFSAIKSVYVIPTSGITYQPAYIESNEYYFSDTNGIAVPPNLAGTDYKGDFPVTFERIHNSLPHNYKISLSLAGLYYLTPRTSDANAANKYAKVNLIAKSLSSSGFIIEVLVQVVSRLTYLKCRYLAVNFPDTSLFHFVSVTYSPNEHLSSSSMSYTVLHFTPSALAEYNIILVLRGIDITMAATGTYYIWSTSISTTSTHSIVYFTGQNGFLRMVAYELIYYKKILLFNQLTSTIFHTRIAPIGKQSCWGSNGYGGCIGYDSHTHVPSFRIFPNNYFLGLNDFGARGKIHYSIDINYNTLDVWLPSMAGVRHNGILFFSYQCPNGFYFQISKRNCIKCVSNCLACDADHCFSCAAHYLLDTAEVSYKFQGVLPSTFEGCLFIEEAETIYKCHLCDKIRNMILQTQQKGCKCMDGHYWDPNIQTCKDFCGDGLIFQTECDDGNQINGDGCSFNCLVEEGFNCEKQPTGSRCYSNQQLIYSIHDISKDQSEQNKGIIILKPKTKIMPYAVLKNNFLSSSVLNLLNFQILIDNQSSQKTLELEFKIDKVQKNQIYLTFYYNFTVENLNAQITLNYYQTRYKKTIQTLNFKLIGSNTALKYSYYHSQYNILSTNILTTVILSMLGLLVGLFLPKFIGLQTIITMQLIYYSQLLVVDYQQWPVGFIQFINLKVATGYDQVFDMTEYMPLTNVTKKYHRLFIHKTVVENINISFVILVVFAFFFYLSSWLMYQKEAWILREIHQSLQSQMPAKPIQKKTYQEYNQLKKINQTFYWISSQLSVWLILPLISSIAGQIFISNNLVYQFNQDEIQSNLLSLRGIQTLLLIVVIFSIGLNFFLNIFLSFKTMRKIEERPEQLFYKKILFLYLFIMGSLIFFFSHIKIKQFIPVSLICLIIHLLFLIIILIIKPYKQSLRIHAFALYMNQILYLIFLTVINLINFIPEFDQIIMLLLSYFINCMVWLLIIFTVFRLYFEIRYGEGLEKKIQQERRKKKQKQKKRKEEKLKQKINQLQVEAKQKTSQKQKKRSLNKYLMDTQLKEQQKQNLLEWLETRNWDKRVKQQYYYNQFLQKPLQWIKKNDKEGYKKRMEQKQAAHEAQLSKIQQKNENPDYKQLVTKLKNGLQNKKKQKLSTLNVQKLK